jgi:hypothetical protein
MAGKERTFAAVLVALLILTVLPSHTTGQVPGQISMECGADPEIVVKPGESSDGIVECVVTNDGTLIAESIEITSEFAGGPTISMAISEDSFSSDAGERSLRMNALRQLNMISVLQRQLLHGQECP